MGRPTTAGGDPYSMRWILVDCTRRGRLCRRQHRKYLRNISSLEIISD